jgi:hypothetical protein
MSNGVQMKQRVTIGVKGDAVKKTITMEEAKTAVTVFCKCNQSASGYVPSEVEIVDVDLDQDEPDGWIVNAILRWNWY